MSEHAALRSYSSEAGLLAALRDSPSLVASHRRGIRERVAEAVAELRQAEARVVAETGVQIERLRVLDIGPGQHLMQMAYFAARGNHVEGVDRDVVVQGLDPRAYWRTARSNGLARALKTAGRKTLGIDRRYRAELERELGLTRPVGRLPVHQMNAWDLLLPDGSFDFVYSFRVFMHLHEPLPALRELVRVLAPGGVAYVDLMPYTGPSGCLDVRTLGGSRHELPPWAHLRPQHRHLVRESANLNRLRLTDWRELFAELMPGHVELTSRPDAARLTVLAEELRARGELLEYAVDELVTSGLQVVWRRLER